MSSQMESIRTLREAAVWRLLSLLLERPRPETRSEVESVARESGDSDLVAWAAAAAKATEGLYLGLLGPGGLASPRAVAYRNLEDPGRILSELTALYDAFAYRPNSEDPIDHIAVEAGFAGYLMLKQAYAAALSDEEALAVTRQAMAGFLREHLCPLAEALAQRLSGSDTYLESAAAILASRAGERVVT